MHPEQRVIRAKLANAASVAKKSNRPADAAHVDALRRDFRAGRLAEHIAQVVAAAPPLTDEQRDKLTLLLHCGNSA